MKSIFTAVVLAVAVAATGLQAAEVKMKPFVLASKGAGDVGAMAADATGKLKAAGFEIAGTYSPYPTAQVIVVTNDALRKAAAKSEFGAYGAAMRVAVTKVKDEVQVSYTNPTYVASAYRMKDDLADAKARLEKALGKGAEFGPKDGMNDSELRDYHYMFGMEYFDDQTLLVRQMDAKTALDTVVANLAKGLSGITQVYRIDIPGTKDVIFGVAMNGAKGGGDNQDDTFIMKEIDFKALRSTAHLPYELLVSGDKVYAFSARFRIAINFPDLVMMGDNSFMNIMGAPDAITAALKKIAGG